jgi:hypothetical protein
MHIGFDEDLVDTLDIPSPPRLCVVMTTRPSSNPGLATLTDGQRDCLRLGNRGRFLCAGASQIDPGVIHTAGDSFWLRPGC